MYLKYKMDELIEEMIQKKVDVYDQLMNRFIRAG